MKLKYILPFLVAFSAELHAQDPHLSQYFSVPVFYNPALAGNDIQNLRIALDYRNQWIAPGVSFKTQTIALDKVVNRVGFGLMINKNSAGKDGISRLSILGGLSYTARFGDKKLNRLTAGFQVGILQKSFNPAKLTFDNQYTPDIGYDPSASSGETFANTKVSRPDVNAGLNYSYGLGNNEVKVKPFVGVSFAHINKPKESFIEANNENPIRTTVYGGTAIKCSDNLELKPMVYFMKQDVFEELNAGVISQFNLKNANAVRFGVFYRNNDAAIVYAGYQMGKVFLGTSYDFNVSKYKPGGSGAYEISLVYTPQGKIKGKRVEEGTDKPIKKKNTPEPKLTPPESYTLAPVRMAATMTVVSDEPTPVKLAAQNLKTSKASKETQDRNNLNYEQAGYVVFEKGTIRYNLNNRFDVIEAAIDYLFKYPQQKVLLAGNVSDVELNQNSALGMQRALAVKAYMVGKGIEADRIEVMDMKNQLPKSFMEEGVSVERLSRTDIYLIK
ncbi:MAG: PorP/SprF family type IX secretion system membrane protein [Bacteroidetes bacterium]|jgi:type IX secretion system PorP/SprF family membrane protein|nr:PorP/SprF family type IX secretion system membrane protein [Bacteroidota bacterium]